MMVIQGNPKMVLPFGSTVLRNVRPRVDIWEALGNASTAKAP
jgi:hypothetical protein